MGVPPLDAETKNTDGVWDRDPRGYGQKDYHMGLLLYEGVPHGVLTLSLSLSLYLSTPQSTRSSRR